MISGFILYPFLIGCAVALLVSVVGALADAPNGEVWFVTFWYLFVTWAVAQGLAALLWVGTVLT